MTQADARALRTIHNYHIHKILFPREIKKYSAILDEALEKQIPKKPTKVEEEFRYMEVYKCPNCGKNFSGREINRYCYHCGQCLDWREDDNENGKEKAN